MLISICAQIPLSSKNHCGKLEKALENCRNARIIMYHTNATHAGTITSYRVPEEKWKWALCTSFPPFNRSRLFDDSALRFKLTNCAGGVDSKPGKWLIKCALRRLAIPPTALWPFSCFCLLLLLFMFLFVDVSLLFVFTLLLFWALLRLARRLDIDHQIEELLLK